MAVTRRTIWMDDESWDAIRRRADEDGISPSQWLKALAFANVGIPNPFPRETSQVAAEVHRDLGLGPDVRVEFDQRSVVERPFATFNPAPKPGRK